MERWWTQIWKCKSKPQWNTTSQSHQDGYINKGEPSKVLVRIWRNWKLYIFGGNVKQHSHFGNSLVADRKLITELPYVDTQPSNSTRYIPKIIKNRLLKKDLYMNAYSDTIQDSEKCKQSNVHQKNMVYSYNRIVFNHKKKWSTTMCYSRMNCENTMLREKHQIPRNTYSIIPFNEMSRTGRFTERKSSSAVIRGQG